MRVSAKLLLHGANATVVVLLAAMHAHQHGYSFLSGHRILTSVGYVVLLSIAAYSFGLPDLVGEGRAAISAAVVAVGSAAVVVSMVQLLFGDALLPRFVVLGAPVLLIPAHVMASRFASGARSRAEQRDRAFFVGGSEDALALIKDVEHHAERPVFVAGAASIEELMAAGAPDDGLVQRVAAARATVLVLARGAFNDPEVVRQSALLHAQGLRVRTLSLFYEQWLGKLPVSELEQVSLMFDISEIHRAVYGRTSRVFDLGLSALGMVLLGIVTPFVLVGNLLANRGPLLYRQDRVGKNGQVFSILKFRTMRPGDAAATNWTETADPRITPFGGILRRAHLDELPQVINVLRGDLSIVGPRPEQPHYVEQLTAKLPFYEFRHLVRPGMTGWAQVMYGYAGSELDALEKLQYEFFYLRNQGLLLDVRIVVRTLRSIVGRRGR